MGTSLNGLTPSATYSGLIKFGDNSAITASLKALSDGNGNDTILSISTSALQIGGSTGLYWNDTDKRLGIGTSAPVTPLEVRIAGSGNIAYFGTSTNSLGIFTDNSTYFASYTSSNTDFRIGTGGSVGSASNTVTFKDSNKSLGIGVTPTARLHIQGSGSTSATTSLLVQNSAGTTALEVKDNLTVGMGGAFVNSNAGAYVTVASFSASYAGILLNSTSGTASKAGIGLDGAKLFFGDETNSTTLYGYRAMIDLRNGGFVVKNDTAAGATASLNSSAVLQADSTTRGFLPPRMTTTQKNAIATPAAGLVVYDTTLAKLCVYTTTWETITSL